MMCSCKGSLNNAYDTLNLQKQIDFIAYDTLNLQKQIDFIAYDTLNLQKQIDLIKGLTIVKALIL